MENQKSSNDGQREKRRIRLFAPASMVSTQSTQDTGTTTSQSIRSALSVRLARRESRKVARKASSQGKEGESSEPTQHDESFRPEEEDCDDDDDQPSSHYSLPGAFRVKRKLGSGEQIECTLEEGSVESFSTAKTPPVVIPSASLVIQESFQEPAEEQLPIAYHEPHVLLVTKRHFCICITLSCLMFGGLFTGLLFALWDRHKLATTSEKALNFNPTTSETQKPTWDGITDNNQTFPSASVTSHPSVATTNGSPTPSPVVYATQWPTVADQLSLTSAPNGFSLTNRPTSSTTSPTYTGTPEA